MEWQTALETGALFICHMAQIVKMQACLSSLISTSHLFSLRTECFLLILLLVELPVAFMIFPMKNDGCESSARVIGFICPTQTRLGWTTTRAVYTFLKHNFEIHITDSHLLNVYLGYKSLSKVKSLLQENSFLH